ncbi:MAG: molybdate ABC transporter substrate-binding protein [Desulfuromonadales bacterium]|nr:molybdate ABC transporter substrate-binding protein [Desulfuromonadales bacterium]
MQNRWTLALGFILSLIALAFPVLAAEVRISAASSLTEAVSEICSRYSARHPGVTLVRNFASSGTLANQINSGAPVDIFISANPKWMDYLIEQDRIPQGGVRVLATNALVVVGSKQKQGKPFAAMTKFARIVIGSPKSVPAGEYAEKALKAVGIYEQLQEENRLVIAKDVRQALMYAERGEVDAAFVYRTDALLARNAVIIYVVPQELYPSVTYPVGLTAEGTKNRAAEDFFTFLTSPEAAMVLGKYGFVTEMQPFSP